MFELRTEPFDTEVLRQQMFNPRAGAWLCFEGWVRDHHGGRGVLHLEYEAYESLCLKEAQQLEQEMLAEHDILALSCVHRIGFCPIGEMAVWLGVSAEHRQAAFAACEDYMNPLKQRLPIWKKESYVAGDSGWVRSEDPVGTE